MKTRRFEIFGMLSMAISVLVLISLLGYNPQEDPHISPNVQVLNPMGILGVWISYLFIKLTFGYASYILPILGIIWGWWFFSRKNTVILSRISGYLIGVMVLFSSTLGIAEIYRGHAYYKYCGLFGGLTGRLISDFLGFFGAFLILFVFWLVLIRGYFSLSFYSPINKLTDFFKKQKAEKLIEINIAREEQEKRIHTKSLLQKLGGEKQIDQDNGPEPGDNVSKPVPDAADESEDSGDSAQDKNMKMTETSDSVLKAESSLETGEGNVGRKIKKGEVDFEIGRIVEEQEVNLDQVKGGQTPKRKYRFPSAELLKTPQKSQDGMSREELVDRATFLGQSLKTFGVDGKVVNVNPGPIITLFEVEPAEGVRVNKFVALSNDLARVMEASRVRVIAPIPGKSSVGIEIPNRNPDMVYFKSVINSDKFAKAKSKLTLAVGKTTTGEIATLDLSKMPHLLVAGTTGSGKSVCMNSIIASILYRAAPDEVKFVIIDPKKVEMTLFKAMEGYHLLNISDIDEAIVTSSENSVLALRAVEKEMDRRYDTLADAVVRNIDEYNARMLKNKKPIMPFIVVIIDELADLMMMNSKDVEAPIARLAQLARAVGIHLVVATQRPSVDVITGVIKANFPSRIAFQVASKVDSRTIIDQSGAEKLIGRGDMLYLGHGASEPTRLHNAFLTLEEIEAIMKHLVSQPKPDEYKIAGVREAAARENLTGDFSGDRDDLFKEAVRLVILHQQGSISLLQRRLKIGYSRAARLIDEMEQARIVGPFTGSKAREILVDETYLNSLDS
ncbi:MAG: DNA translocase FtsK [Candidatus Neomarinimicrobiota bacterium]